MSSLLDILHRKDGANRPDNDSAWASPADPAQTVELHLAVDNGLPESATTGGDDLGIDESADHDAEPYPPQDPYATVGGRYADAGGHARPLSAASVRQRSRRGTLWLATGLGLLIAAAGIATWLLTPSESGLQPDDSLFTNNPEQIVSATQSTSRDGSANVASVATDTAAAPATTPIADPAAIPAADPDWFDTPAIDDPGFDYNSWDQGELRAAPIQITRGTTTNPLFPKLSSAWTAYQAADFVTAEELYRAVRTADPDNIDALLGLGALAVRGGRNDEAIDLYRSVLRLEPTNATALGALSTLPGGVAGNPAAGGARTQMLDESALKTLLREQPSAANLHFALGLQYAAESRWPDAQQAFFEAVRNDPGNADYAYNLAVSLDRLGQGATAAGWYQRALDVATASALFNPALARQRLADLRQTGS